MLKRLHSSNSQFAEQLEVLLHRNSQNGLKAEHIQQVTKIIDEVRANGDAALLDYTQRFDGFNLSDVGGLEATSDELLAALEAIEDEQRNALEYAASRIRDYHEHQLQASWNYTDENGNVLGQRVTAIERAGLYVPGGKAAYPSSVLMNAIPAKVAGVSELVMVTPTPKGKVSNMVLAAAKISGVDRVFKIGGAQAIAALAYGTDSVPRVDKITGPGNAYVAAAKQQVYGVVGIDMIAGPSEVLIIADNTANPDWVAMDLFAQAEHDEQAQSILLTRDAKFADAVLESMERLLPEMPRRSIISDSLRNNGAVIIADDEKTLVQIADAIAAEHLEIFTHNADDLAKRITNAGAMFVGEHSAESLGDYCVGPNHVLPTAGTARFSSPLGVYDFQKRTSVIRLTRQGAQELAHNAAILAEGESLSAHAAAARYRLKC